jgi:FMN phosphatase YigB (HAD superfamily)
MRPIQIVSVDLFNTLVDLSNARLALWQTVLGKASTRERINQVMASNTQMIFSTLDQINVTSVYQPIRAVYKTCFPEVFKRFQIVFDPQEAAEFLICRHAQSPWFPDAVPWLENMRRSFRVCLSSDTDEAMVGEHIRQYPFDMFFTSQGLGAYKGDSKNRFFEAVVAHYALPPWQIFHVGDSPSEIAAAQRVGLQTCWVNRNGLAWPFEDLPDYEVASLEAIIAIFKNVDQTSL